MCTLKKMTALVCKFIICSPQLLASYARKVVYLSLNDRKDQLSQKTTIYFVSPIPQKMVQVLFFYAAVCKGCLAARRLRLVYSVSLAMI